MKTKSKSEISDATPIIFALLALAILLTTNIGCTQAKGDTLLATPPAFGGAATDKANPQANALVFTGAPVSIMAFNVENLFDNKHDAGKTDYAFLPLSEKSTPEIQAACDKAGSPFYIKECKELNWDDKTLEAKLNSIAQAIAQIQNGAGPDILMLEEVENLNVLKMLNAKLTKANYQTVILIEGPDQRGIDTAVLSRFPISGTAKLHTVPPVVGSDGALRPTRGILEAPLVLRDGTVLHVLAAHLPSQSNPRVARVAAFDSARKVIANFPAADPVVFGGDLNVSAEEESQAGFFKQFASEGWAVAHFVGCKSCQGTEVFKGTWSYLDTLLFSPMLATFSAPAAAAKTPTPPAQKPSQLVWKLNPASIRLADADPNQKHTTGAPSRLGQPKRFDPKTLEGVSDHFPIYAEIGQVQK
jgi:endonuclease/exonuclease/phosphatase family metal-dependent hydrolase